MKSVGLCSTSDVITFDQNWHRLYSSSAGGKDFSNDTQIRVIISMEPLICTKMLRNLSAKCAAKFPATTLSYSMVKIACLDDAFSEILELGASPVKGQSLPQKDKKRRKRKGEKKIKKTEKPKDVDLSFSRQKTSLILHMPEQ